MYFILIICLLIIVLYISSRCPKKRRPVYKTYIPPSDKTLKIKINSPKMDTTMAFENADMEYYRDHQRLYYGGFAITPGIDSDLNPPAYIDINDEVGQFHANDYMPDDLFDRMLADEAYRADEIINPRVVPIRLDTQALPTILNRHLLEPDSQNVHDTEVCNAVRKIFSCTDIVKEYNRSELIHDINEYIDKSDRSVIDRSTIRDVLNQVSDRNSPISNINDATELQLLATVWKESNDPNKTSEERQNIKDMLLTQISDTFENARILCPTGFVNRIATALVVDDLERFPKTKNMIHNEMMESASHVRDVLEKDTKYNELSDNDKTETFKTKLNEKLDKDYDGILSRAEIEELIAPWIDHV